MIGHVYTLSCSKTNKIIYVGSTQDLKARVSTHKSNIKNSHLPVYKYLKSNKSLPVMEIIETIVFCNHRELLICEAFWTEQFRQWGFPLMNIANASSGSLTPPLKQVIKVDAAIVSMVREYKKISGISIGDFFEMAILKKLRLEAPELFIEEIKVVRKNKPLPQ